MVVKRWEDLDEKDLRYPLKRAEVLEAIKRVLDLSFSKLENRYTKNPEKIKWSRIVVQASAAAGSLLRDTDLDDLKARVERLEER